MLLEGGVNAPIWCYFITEIQKQVVPKILYRSKDMTEQDILYLYDNAKAHNDSISEWWMSYIDSTKMTICPYTPEMNPIERMFNTLKWKSSDGIERSQLLELTEYIAWHMN